MAKVALAISAGIVRPLDTVALRCSDAFVLNETVTFTHFQDITIGSYGCAGQTVDRPKIYRPNGPNSGPVLQFNNASGFTLTGLEIAGAEIGLSFFFQGPPPQRYDGFTITDCYFHDIRGVNGTNHTSDWWGAAIVFAAEYAGFTASGITVANNLFNDSDTAYRNQLTDVPLTTRAYVDGLRFANNTLTGMSFNTLFLDTTTNVTVSGNVFMNNTPSTLFFAGTTDIILGTVNSSVVIEGNEIGRRGEYPGGPDGCAIDFETNANGTVVRGNYIHRSWGAGIMVLGHQTPNTNLLIEGNVMLYNGCNQTLSDHGGMAFLHANATGTIQSNVFATCPNVSVFSAPNPTYLDGFMFVNNTIASAENPVFVADQPTVTQVASTLAGTMNFTAAFVTPGCTLRYTLDGSKPTSASATWPSSGWLAIPARTTAVNVKAFADGMLESACVGGILSPLQTA